MLAAERPDDPLIDFSKSRGHSSSITSICASYMFTIRDAVISILFKPRTTLNEIDNELQRYVKNQGSVPRLGRHAPYASPHLAGLQHKQNLMAQEFPALASLYEAAIDNQKETDIEAVCDQIMDLIISDDLSKLDLLIAWSKPHRLSNVAILVIYNLTRKKSKLLSHFDDFDAAVRSTLKARGIPRPPRQL